MVRTTSVLDSPGIPALRPFRVDPFDITCFDRSDEDLEVLFCFCACVAGKRARMVSGMVERFLEDCGFSGSAFARIRAMLDAGTLDDNLKRVRVGRYTVLGRLFAEMTAPGAINLRTATTAELEKLPGIGHKTSRFFIVHSRPASRFAVIDTHMLKYLRQLGVTKIPKAIPVGQKYRSLETIVLSEADRLNLTPADFDLQVWSWYSSGKGGAPEFKSGLGLAKAAA